MYAGEERCIVSHRKKNEEKYYEMDKSISNILFSGKYFLSVWFGVF